MTFRELRADEIDIRIGSVTKKGVTLLFYKDARCDMNILDETVGADNWQRDHKEVKGNLYCGVAILCGDQWVWKWDCGTESYTEKEKGEASDSFKRACFNWGIGRELYTAPFTFVNCETEQKEGRYILTENGKKKIAGAYVSNIQYLERKIVGVTVCDKDGNVLFKGGKKIQQEKKTIDEPIDTVTAGGLDYLQHLILEVKANIDDIYAYYKVQTLSELTAKQFNHLVRTLEQRL